MQQTAAVGVQVEAPPRPVEALGQAQENWGTVEDGSQEFVPWPTLATPASSTLSCMPWDSSQASPMTCTIFTCTSRPQGGSTCRAKGFWVCFYREGEWKWKIAVIALPVLFCMWSCDNIFCILHFCVLLSYFHYSCFLYLFISLQQSEWCQPGSAHSVPVRVTSCLRESWPGGARTVREQADSSLPALRFFRSSQVKRVDSHLT